MLGRPRVLVVEDDPDLLVVLRVNLESVGIEPILASDGSTAIARIQAERPDAVLLDMMLPGVDGWQVLADLHRINDPVPIVVCSAKKNPQDMARARELGAHAYVVKPFDIERLLEAVLDATGRPARAADAERAIDPGTPGLELA